MKASPDLLSGRDVSEGAVGPAFIIVVRQLLALAKGVLGVRDRADADLSALEGFHEGLSHSVAHWRCFDNTMLIRLGWEAFMDIELDWQANLAINDNRGSYQLDFAQLPKVPGIYMFCRKYGDNFETLYIGKANNLRSRVKQQFNNHKLITHVKTARNGARVLRYAIFQARPGQQAANCIALAEKALIRHFVAENHDLVNQQGTKLRQHLIRSTGNHKIRFFPKEVSVEK